MGTPGLERSVVPKWMSLGSLTKGGNFNSWEGKLWKKNLKFSLFVYSTSKKLHSQVGLDGNVYITQGQGVSTAMTNVIKQSV